MINQRGPNYDNTTANEQGNGGYDPADSSNTNTAQGSSAGNNSK